MYHHEERTKTPDAIVRNIPPSWCCPSTPLWTTTRLVLGSSWWGWCRWSWRVFPILIILFFLDFLFLCLLFFVFPSRTSANNCNYQSNEELHSDPACADPNLINPSCPHTLPNPKCQTWTDSSHMSSCHQDYVMRASTARDPFVECAPPARRSQPDAFWCGTFHNETHLGRH